MRETCTATVMIDDARVRVARFDFAPGAQTGCPDRVPRPGAQTGWHRHGHDYVITAVTDCPMRIEMPDGTTRQVLVPAGTACRRDQGVAHNVINDGAVAMTFVEVELK